MSSTMATTKASSAVIDVLNPEVGLILQSEDKCGWSMR